jgi:hypothetical protein
MLGYIYKKKLQFMLGLLEQIAKLKTGFGERH